MRGLSPNSVLVVFCHLTKHPQHILSHDLGPNLGGIPRDSNLIRIQVDLPVEGRQSSPRLL